MIHTAHRHVPGLRGEVYDVIEAVAVTEKDRYLVTCRPQKKAILTFTTIPS